MGETTIESTIAEVIQIKTDATVLLRGLGISPRPLPFLVRVMNSMWLM